MKKKFKKFKNILAINDNCRIDAKKHKQRRNESSTGTIRKNIHIFEGANNFKTIDKMDIKDRRNNSLNLHRGSQKNNLKLTDPTKNVRISMEFDGLKQQIGKENTKVGSSVSLW